MESAQEILFVAIFALLLGGLAVYFRYLVGVVWRRVGSIFLRTGVLAACTCVWSLGASGLAEYCGSWARALRQTQVAYDLRQVGGVFLMISLASFVASIAGAIIG